MTKTQTESNKTSQNRRKGSSRPGYRGAILLVAVALLLDGGNGQLQADQLNPNPNSGTISIAEINKNAENSITFTNLISGIIRTSFPSALINSGTLNNYGTIETYYGMNNSGTLNNYGTLLNQGRLFNNGTLDNQGTLLNPGEMNITSGTFYQNSGSSYSGAGTIVLGGTLNNTSNNTFQITNLQLTGGTLINNGIGQLSIDTATVASGNTGLIQGSSGINLSTANVDGTLTIITPITGTGSLTKSGTGTLYLTEANTYTGSTNINAGTLSVNGSINSNVNIASAGTLKGTGTISGNVTNSGIIAPGNSIGTTTITGNYTHNAGAIYQVEVNAAGQSDKLLISGTATINGSTVSVLADNKGSYNTSTTYTILTAGVLNGTFSTVTSNLAFLTPSLAYSSTDVLLTMTRNSNRYSSVALTSNQRAVATVFDGIPGSGSGDMATVITALNSLSADGARSAYNQMGGLSHTALGGVTFSLMGQQQGVLSSRVGGFTSGNMLSADSGGLQFAANGGIRSDAPANWVPTRAQSGLWVRGYGGVAQRRGDDVSARYDSWTGGTLFGFDQRVGDSLLLGVAGGYAHGEVTMSDLSGSNRIDSYQFSTYGAYKGEALYLTGQLSYGYNQYETSRNISFGGLSRKAKADYAGHGVNGYLESGYRVRTAAVDIIPMAGFQGSVLMRDGFSERGADALNLIAGADSTTSLQNSLGVRFTREFKTANGLFTPELRTKWLHEFSDDSYLLNAAFAGAPAATFTVKNDIPSRNRAAVGAGLTFAPQKNLNLFVAYDANLAADGSQHGGSAGLRYEW